MPSRPEPPLPPDKPPEAMTVDELAAAIRYHNWRYFVVHDPVVSDWAFDALTRRLAALAPGHPALAELVSDAAPPETADTAGLMRHDSAMLSLEKAYDAATVQTWAATLIGDVVEAPKIDGVAASLRYDANGRLVAAVTRGDGIQGELFTANARFIASIPQVIADGPAEVRGEVFLPLSVFRARFADTFANPRNTCAGGIKQKEAARTGDYGLRFLAYGVRGREFAKLSEGLAWTRAQGFEPVPYALRARADVQAGWEGWLARRAELDYELDGVVYTADLVSEQRRLGETSHHPRWAIAYKFQGESGETRITAIEWSVSRSGAITPVAVVEPITLSGASVSRCSLHNLAILRTLGASVGARVVAMRRGGVIPHIEAVLEPGPAPAPIPDECPMSGHPTEVHGDVLMCSEPHHCPAARLGTLDHFLKVVSIDGFGPKILAMVVERGWVREPADFYRLRAQDLAGLERLGRKSAQNLIASIESKRQIPLATFLAALGVDDLGQVAAQKVADAFRTLPAVMAASEADIAAIYGLGEITARSIRSGLDHRKDLVAGLTEVVTVTDFVPAPVTDIVANPDDPLAGKSFVFTGKLQSFDRKTAQGLVRARGGTTPEDVSRALDFLVIGDEGSPLLGGAGADAKSSKHKKAEKLIADGAPIRIIAERDFRAMVTRPT